MTVRGAGETPRPLAPPTGSAPEATAAQAEPESGLRQTLEKGFTALKDSFIVSGLINVAGTAFVNVAFGVPFDPRIALSFAVIGTVIGASYGPAKSALLGMMAGHGHTAGAPLAPPNAEVPST